MYPGFMSTDSVGQLTQARTNRFDDWHPPIMALIWRYIDMIWPGPFGMLLLDLLLVWGGTFLIVRYAFPSRIWLQVLIPLLVVFFPPVFSVIGVIWKDIFMAGCLLMGFGLLAAAQHSQYRRKLSPLKKIGMLCGSIFFFLLATALRHNAIIAVMPGFIFLGIIWFFKRKLLAIRILQISSFTIFATVMCLIISTTLNSSIADKKLHAWQTVALFDIAGVIANMEQPLNNRANFLLELGNIKRHPDIKPSQVRRKYQSWYWAPLTRGKRAVFSLSTDANELQLLKTVWVKAFLYDPKAYFKHRWAMFEHVLGISSLDLWSPIYMKPVERGAHRKLVDHYYELSSVQQTVKKWLFKVKNKTLIYQPVIYFVLAVLLTPACLWIAFKNGYWMFLFLNLSGILYEASLFLLAPSFDFRYSHWMILTTLITMLATVSYGLEVVARAFPRRRFG